MLMITCLVKPITDLTHAQTYGSNEYTWTVKATPLDTLSPMTENNFNFRPPEH